MSRPGHFVAKSPRITIVIPTHNRASVLPRALISVINQSYSKLDIVVIDDGSTDDTSVVVRGFADHRIRYISLDGNTGGASARNRGVAEAAGDFIAFLDSDDYWDPKKIEKQVAQVLADGDPTEIVVYSQIRSVFGDYATSAPTFPWDQKRPLDEYLILHKQHMQTSGLLVPRELASKVRFNETLRKHQDLDFVLQLRDAGARFVLCRDAIVFFDNTTHHQRVSTAPNPQYTLDFLDKWGIRLTRRTRACLLVTYVAPLNLRTHPGDAIGYYLKSLPESLLRPKDIIDGLLMWNSSERTYSAIRTCYRRATRRRA